MGVSKAGQEGREESPWREASSRWTLSNKTSLLDHASLPLMRTPLGCSQPHRTGHGFSLGLPNKSSPRTITLAPSRVRHAPSLKEVKPANKGRKFPSKNERPSEEGKLEALTSEKAIQPSKECKTPSRSLGLPPRGSLARPPRKLDYRKCRGCRKGVPQPTHTQ